MVTYGPWVEPTEHLEVIRLGPFVGVEVIGDVRSGIVFDQGRVLSEEVTSGRTVGAEPSVLASSETWEVLTQEPLDDGISITGVRGEVHHTGTHTYFVVGDYWYQTDSWSTVAGNWDIWQSASPTPPTLPPGAIDIDWDGGSRLPPTLLELTVEQLGPHVAEQWGFKIAAEGHPGELFGAGLSLDELMHSDRPGWAGTGGGHTWTEAELATIQSLLTPTSAGRLSRTDARWPSIVFGWSGGYPGSDPTTELAHGPYEFGYDAQPTMEMRVRFLRQRHRFVYLEDETVQRTYPRDDGLAGGAERNWPASRSYQAGNRTSAGHW